MWPQVFRAETLPDAGQPLYSSRRYTLAGAMLLRLLRNQAYLVGVCSITCATFLPALHSMMCQGKSASREGPASFLHAACIHTRAQIEPTGGTKVWRD